MKFNFHQCRMAAWRSLSLCLLLAAAWSSHASSSVKLDWNPSESVNVAGYFIYIGSSSGVFSQRVDAGPSATANISALSEGKDYYFTVTAYDAAGNESLPSEEVHYITPGLGEIVPDGAGSLSIQFGVTAGHWYAVEFSLDMQHWEVAAWAYGLENSWQQFTDWQQPDLPQYFYRLAMY